MMHERIRNLQEDLNFTQKQIAERLIMARASYSNYELGKRNIPSKKLGVIADILNTSIDYLTGRTDEKNLYPKKNKYENNLIIYHRD